MGAYSGKGLGEGGKSLLNVRRGQKMSDYARLIRPASKTRHCLFRLAGLGKVRCTISLDYIFEGQLIKLASPGVIFNIQNL